MTPELIKFIKDNKNLINENTKKSWKEIYNKLRWGIVSEFTQTLLNANIDPAKTLSYIPRSYLYNSNITNYEIPNSVTSIGDDAFRNCSSLTSVIIPDSVTSIGDKAFYNCDSLTSVVIPNSVTSIGERAFSYCRSLTEITFKGTKKQAIQLGIGNRSRKKWREGSAIQRIICTDGVIEL